MKKICNKCQTKGEVWSTIIGTEVVTDRNTWIYVGSNIWFNCKEGKVRSFLNRNCFFAYITELNKERILFIN